MSAPWLTRTKRKWSSKKGKSTGKRARTDSSFSLARGGRAAAVPRALAAQIRSVALGMEETKYIATEFSQVPSSAASSVNLMNAMVQGVTRATRLANRIRTSSLFLNVTVEPSAGAILATRVRCMVVLDTQPNGVALAGLDLTQPGTLLANAFYAPYNPNTVPSRYRILMDKQILCEQGVVAQFNPATGATQAIAQQPAYFRKRILLKFQTKYNEGNAGTIADINDNALWVVSFSSQAALVAPAIFIQSTFKFKDA